jgi:hypothetical protein
MGLAIPVAVTATPPVLAGVLVWWGVVLAAPALLIRRWRRRHPGALRGRRGLSAPRAAEVKPAICHPFSPPRPRLWYRPDDHGAWVRAWLIGGDSVIGWLEQFGREHGRA